MPQELYSLAGEIDFQPPELSFHPPVSHSGQLESNSVAREDDCGRPQMEFPRARAQFLLTRPLALGLGRRTTEFEMDLSAPLS